MKRVLLKAATPGRRRVDGPAFHHLAHVLRVRVDESVEAFDGAGGSFEARVVSIADDAIELELGQRRAAPIQRKVTMVLGLSKPNSFEWALEKCTELGATSFVPVNAHRSVVRLSDGAVGARVTRWQAIVDGAARQCQRSDTPTVSPPIEVARLADVLGPEVRSFLLDEEEHVAGLTSALRAVGSAEQPVALIIGPEGGWERGEVEALKRGGAVPTTIGASILRAETAAVVSLALVRAFDGELG